MDDNLHSAVEILMMAMALGADAFSLAIGLGLNGLTRRRALQLSGLIGFFHLFMTLSGFTLGMFMGGVLGQVAQWFGAFLLVGLGIHMVYSSLFVKQQVGPMITTGTTMVLFSAGVSVDALSVGFSLGLRSTAYGITSSMAFGVVGAAMCLAGIVIGKRANAVLGIYGELIGAAILIGYGIHFMLT